MRHGVSEQPEMRLRQIEAVIIVDVRIARIYCIIDIVTLDWTHHGRFTFRRP